MVSFISDGYTEDGFIAESPRLHGPLRFKYRPALIEESSGLFEQTSDKKNAQQQERITARFMSKHLISWDLTDPQGNQLPITVENLLRLNRRLAQRLHNIVLCYEASDEDGQTIDLAADAKNSPPG